MSENMNEKQSRQNAVLYVWGITFGILIFYMFFSGALIAVTKGQDGNVNNWVLVISELFFLLLPTVIAVQFLEADWRYIIRFVIPGWKVIIVAAIGVFFLQLITEGIVQLQYMLIPENWQQKYIEIVNDYTEMTKDFVGTGSTITFMSSVFAVAVVPAVSEEFLFKGFLQTTLEYHTKVFYAILFSSLLFGIMHLNIVIFLPLTIMSLYLGYVSYRTSSIIMPMILHFSSNFYSVTTLFYFGNELDTGFSPNENVTEVLLFIIAGLSGLAGICYYIYLQTKSTKTTPQIGESEDA